MGRGLHQLENWIRFFMALKGLNVIYKIRFRISAESVPV